MTKIQDWCKSTKENVNGHSLHLLNADAAKLDAGIAALATSVPHHYAAPTRIDELFKRLGKSATAKYIAEKLPQSKKLRSGDLGEILGSSFVEQSTPFSISISKLRWKDHREMAMRGEDLVGLQPVAGVEKIRFLKGEVKSAAKLTAATVAKARTALKKSNSRPSPHTLEFIADRLHEEGENVLADLIDDALLVNGIDLSQMYHLVFTFSGNDPSEILRANVKAYNGSVPQIAAGLRVSAHQKFIADVFAKVISNANGQ
jgi:hypothetical protein